MATEVKNGSAGNAFERRDKVMKRLEMLIRYKRWANESVFEVVRALPDVEALRERPTRWRNIVHTLNHVHVVDEIFRAHLEGRGHGYSARNTDTTPEISELWSAVRKTDDWYVEFTEHLSERDRDETIDFEFVGGGLGTMSREEILLHIVNHGTYHRGLVSDMLYQVPVMLPANDLTVFLRDHVNSPR